MADMADVIAAFTLKGFRSVGKSSDGWFRLKGVLLPPSVTVGSPCEVELDPTFVDLPRVRLLQLPPDLPQAVPHLGADGSLCYVSKGSVSLDIFDPVGQSLACLERAALVFGKIIKGEMVQDLAEEFFAYWPGVSCFVDIAGKDLGRLKCVIAQGNGAHNWFITDDAVRTLEKLKALDRKPTDRTVLTYRVRTAAQPRPTSHHWPPKNVGEVLAWQSTLDPRCRRKIFDRLKQGQRTTASGILIVIDSPLMSYGFAVLYDRKSPRSNKKLSDRRDPLFELAILPVAMVRIDDRYLAERNIPGRKTLAGKKIALIGCGTIGAYLAEMLIKAGAGTAGGILKLVDSDNLYPQNIGRHRLGFPHLLFNKAEAMGKELKRLAPGVNIRTLPVDARQVNLGKLDLLIDATGEESLGHWISGRYGRPASILSVWIEGPGTAVRALLRSGDAGACTRCLWQSNRRGELRSIAGPLPTILAGQGCEGLYVPFPASVSVQAASLAAEIALDWVNDNVSLKLRTRLIDQTQQPGTADCSPEKDRECPICSS